MHLPAGSPRVSGVQSKLEAAMLLKGVVRISLAGEQIDAESTIDDLTLPIKWGPGSVFSTNHPIASSAVGGQMLLLSGSAPFTAHVTALATGDGIYDLNPGAGWDMNYSGVAPEASLGSATVTWQFTVKP